VLILLCFSQTCLTYNPGIIIRYLCFVFEFVFKLFLSEQCYTLFPQTSVHNNIIVYVFLAPFISTYTVSQYERPFSNTYYSSNANVMIKYGVLG